ncbi:MAG TPA: prolyl oligopeptidase family serine peptidase, partial [Salinimicrobium sp.]|nr:prolyl oligopeptidase family serine peptidase [Salinimicrobium sp.]
SFNLIDRGENDRTDVPNYVDASGYTVNLPARSKVGDENTSVELAIYNLKKDNVYFVETGNLPGISDLPDFVKDYPEKEWKEEPREVILSEAYFSDNGENAIVNIRSKDNKDRWIALLDLETGKLKSLDRQRDEAWIAGPGIGWTFGGGTLGWLPDNKHIYFQSEESGYSHLYLLNTKTGKKKKLTSGEFEVFDPFLSNDGKSWYFTSSEVHPGERHFYKMPVMGGTAVKLTSMTGNNEVSLSPDEKYMAILYSYSNLPWELYLKETSAEAKAEKLTSGQSEAFKSYDWRDPQLIKFKAEDGTMIPARLYEPNATAKNGAAVIFVHGAGYLQNVHKWWSSYFREYMFNNLLADLGYTVIDVDYRGSSGYGRDWRTAIYRNMGGKDLSDQVDAAAYLVAEHGVDSDRIGIYGGSYGGFITLMALFTEAETFKSGAALRSVTDWAHYNHGYTANILNEPYLDPIAYRRSSPIYFAEGFKGHLLMAHGMVDTNVHFQDVVRLAQRLIELKKENWEMAIYPVESHGFVEPTSWMDEYKRVLELFNTTLLEH